MLPTSKLFAYRFDIWITLGTSYDVFTISNPFIRSLIFTSVTRRWMESRFITRNLNGKKKLRFTQCLSRRCIHWFAIVVGAPLAIHLFTRINGSYLNISSPHPDGSGRYNELLLSHISIFKCLRLKIRSNRLIDHFVVSVSHPITVRQDHTRVSSWTFRQSRGNLFSLSLTF